MKASNRRSASRLRRAVRGNGEMTPCMRAEQALHESQARFRALFDNSLNAVLIADDNSILVEASPAAADLFGVPAEQITGKSVYDFVDVERGPAAQKRWSEFMAAGFARGEFEIVRPDGQVRVLEYDALANVRPGLHLSTIRDLTEHRRAEEALHESEERFRSYFELGLIGMAITSPTKGVLEVNDEMCRILGYEREELLRMTWAEMTHPDDLAADDALFNRVMAGEIDGYSVDKRWIRKDGEIIDSNISVKCVRRADGSVDYFVALLQDITEHKRAEEALRESEKRYRTLFDSMEEGFIALQIVFDQAGNPADFVALEVNPAFKHLTGIPDIVGKHVREILPDLEESWYRILGKVALTGEPVRTESYAGPLERWFDLNAFRIGGEKSRKVALFLINITGRKRVEEALRKSEERFRAVADLVPDLLWSRDAQGSVEWYNQRWTEYTGQRSEEAAQFGWLDVIHPDDQDQSLAVFYDALDSGQPMRHEHRIRGRDGSYRWFLHQARPLRNEEGRIVHWFGTATDIHEQRMIQDMLEERVRRRTHDLVRTNRSLETEIAEHKRVDAELRELNEMFQALIQAAPLAIYSLDPHSLVRLWNPAAERMFGWSQEEVLGKPLPTIPADMPQAWEQLEASLRGEPMEGYDSRRLRKDNSQVEVSVWNAPVRNTQGEVIANLGMQADNTERKRTQEELVSINRRLRELSGRLLDVHEDERRSIARELHDEIGQQLTALRFMLEGLERPPSRSAGDGSLVFGDSISVTHNTQHTTPVAKRLDSALTILDSVTARVREMSLNLRPSMLDDAGLAPGLLWHAQRYTAQTGIEVDVAHRGLEERLPAAVETAIYRIVQEALTNVARHAGVQHVTVHIMVARGPDGTPLAGNVTVLIEDLGKGFDVSTVLAGHTSTGLSGMRERAELLGGQLIIESQPGAGTRILAEMPLLVAS